MSCSTSIKGRALLELGGDHITAWEYDWWVKNYISIQKDIVQDKYPAEYGDWSRYTLYLREPDSTDLKQVELIRDTFWETEGEVSMSWVIKDPYSGIELFYLTSQGEPLRFTFDPYEGLTRYTVTAVRPLESGDIPDDCQGALLATDQEPFDSIRLPESFWTWYRELEDRRKHPVELLINPHGQVACPNPIATRDIAVPNEWVKENKT